MSSNANQMTPDEIRRLIESRKPHYALDVPVKPEIAKVILEYNRSGETNRRLSRGWVNTTVEAMRGGVWENTGEPIIISDAKLLNDGQHRLEAVVESGLTVNMDIRFGVPRHAFASTNSGAKRSGAQALHLLGSVSATSAASIARLVLAYENGGLPTTAYQRIANGKIVSAVERWPDIPQAVRFTQAVPKTIRNAPVNTVAFFAQRTANAPTVQDFFGVVATGEGRANNPPHKFREAIMRHRGGQDTGTRVRFLAMGILAWNAFRKGKPMERLDWKTADAFPVVDDLKL